MLFANIRKSRVAKVISMTLALEIIAQLLYPIRTFALTTGPSQPEVQNFEPVGTSDMVNVFSGDFSYNIPLLDVDGYPVNISYNSGITMDQESSWTGLGWNINPGAITRNMRGLPDDFKGDVVTKRFNMKPNRTYGVSVGAGVEGFGLDGLGLNYSITVNYNNYKGVGFEQSLNMQFSAGAPAKGELTGGLGITSGSEGLNLTPSLSFRKNIKNKESADVKGTGFIGLSFNSRAGLKKLSLNASVTETDKLRKRSKDKYTYSVNGGAAIDFSTQTYTPQISMPMINTSFAVSFKTGATIFGFDGTVNLSGYFSGQSLERPEEKIPAYGYFNTQTGIGYERSLQDVNREKEGGFTDNTPALPLTNYSYDVFSVAGQGVGGNYRGFRSDLGTISDPSDQCYSVSADLGIEAAMGNLVHGGADVTITDVTTNSGKWSGDDNTSSVLKFRSSSNSGDPLFEPWYFKEAGEKSVDSDTTLFANTGSSDPVRVNLQDGGGLQVSSGTTFKRKYANGNVGTISMPTNNYRAKRQKRNQAISYVTFGNYYDALQPSILNHTHSTMSAYSGARDNHIGEISVLRSDGARYFYGLPAYNIKQQETSFAVQGRAFNASTGLVTYSHTAKDNSVGNTLGIDNYYSMTETPAYAHSYLLTAIISPDYVDYDNTEGPSIGDLGTYTKFNYTKTSSGFKWRTPIGTDMANHNEGYKSETSDDKGSYVYGEKEVWYMSTIETKNYVAVFTISDREDGFGVNDTNGTVGGSALKKLDQIDLYTRPDYIAHISNLSLATPVKTVHFEYDYTLCPSTPNRSPLTNGNGESGKLTLKKIYFTYGKSFKAKLSSYDFTYADINHDGTPDVNYPYNLRGYDRWGNYKPNSITTTANGLDPITTPEFPYVDQDASSANQYAAAWSLTTVKLPSGGRIDVDYESDDYAYVQDRKAMQMFKITDSYIADAAVAPASPGTQSGTAGTNPTRVSLMTQGNYSSKSYYLFFKLQTPVVSSTSSTVIRNMLLNDYLGNNLSNIYFRFLTDITNRGDYEYVSGYFDVDDNSSAGMGVAAASGGFYNYGWIRVKKVNIGDRDNPNQECNPLSKAAWQYGRLQLPRKVWDQPDPQANGVEQTLRAIANSGFFQNIKATFLGPNKTIRNKGYGMNAVTLKSWIRLNSPEGKKLGGGSRVKKITIGDNWKYMTNNSAYTPNDAQYGQEYSYTTVENGKTISSGVASYEPSLGGDENPFRQPVFFKEEKRLVPDDESYLEEPFGESFFPAPGVGYSHVEVRNLQYGIVTRHATGYTVQDFYTARDFPTITRRTDLDLRHKRTNPILALLKIKMKDYVTASQGYVIELNDMHGKPKAQYVYAEGQQQPMSEVHYFYKTNVNNGKQLDNTVNVIQKDGSVRQTQTGLDFDFVNDMREQETKTISGGLNINLAGFLAGIFPAVVPTLFPSLNREETRFRSAVVTKVINRYGILVKTEAHDAGSTVTTENLGWDAETGELLVTKTKNDFDDPVYNFTYPAHWSYDRMGQAYQNLMASFTGATLSGGTLTLPSITLASDYFVQGDELSLKDNLGNHYKAWVCSVGGGNTLGLITKTGAAVTISGSSASVSIVRSGRRNQQALAVGGVTLLSNPLIDSNSDGKYDAIGYDKVINAKAQEYAEHWMMFGGHHTPDHVTCLCVKSTIYTDVANFLNTMQNDHVMLVSGTQLFDGTNYFHGFNSNIKIGYLPAGNMFWYPTISGQTLTGMVSNTPASPGCKVIMNIPAPNVFSQIDSIQNIYPVSNPHACSGGYSYDFTANVVTLSGGHYVMTGTTSCWEMGMFCNTTGTISSNCGKLVGDTVNPYFEDVLGVWRPLRSQLYLADRFQSTASNNTNIRKDGYFVTKDHSTGATIAYQPFWSPNSGNDWIKDPNYWTWSSEVTKYTPYGNEVENMDALYRYSSAVYGYNHSLPIAVASNAHYQDIAFDGFEDYDYIDSTDCRYLHFNFYSDKSHLATAESHTGLYSMKLLANDSITATRSLTSYQPLTTAITCPYTLSDNDLVSTFSPITYSGNKVFVLNYWVKETGLTPPVFSYNHAKVIVKLVNPFGSAVYPVMTLVQKSELIEGWQQYQYQFTIPGASAGSIAVVLKNDGSGSTAYFDDVRLHPFDGNMKSYVYNPVNLRFTSELDENNYATFYEYDEEGSLVRVKKETINGIMTIKESRNNSSHN